MPVLPQFPLGSVLFPSMALPLHVFEPRYRQLVLDVLEGDKTFGVVLIERGSEVGGDDARTNIGTTAEIVSAEQFIDGRWNLFTVGKQRFRIDHWLDDQPYPKAEVSFLDDTTSLTSNELDFDRVVAKFCCLMALASEAGYDVGDVPTSVSDPCLGTFQMAALAPLSTLDKHQLLAEPETVARALMLEKRLDDAVELIRFQLSTETNS